MKAKLITLAVSCAAGAALAAPAFGQGAAPAGKPSQPPVCNTCHQPAPGSVRGYFDNVAFKSRSIQLNLGGATEIVKFDPKTLRVVDAGVAKDAEHLRDVRAGHEARIELVEKDGVKVASAISFKGPIKIAEEKLVHYQDVAKLVAQGPERGGYTLIDSRPLPRFQEGTIPGAINLPFPAFDKLLGRLPKDKERLVIFFCQGVTCMMSPNSMLRAEAMGYTKARVYREGWPEWTQKTYGVISPQSLKEAFLDKGIPYVALDVRQPGEARRSGFIPGAVALPADKVRAALKGFPDKALKAPIVVYDLNGSHDAVRAAKVVSAAGYENVLVLEGGYAAWHAAGYLTAGGPPSVKVAYVPKPRPGSLPIAEFKKIAASAPGDTLILDVRNKDEAKAGMIKGALLVPDEEVLERLAEIPKDKRIVTHCSTGVRAEMAYHKLKEKGYQVAFLNAEVEIGKNGSVTVTPK